MKRLCKHGNDPKGDICPHCSNEANAKRQRKIDRDDFKRRIRAMQTNGYWFNGPTHDGTIKRMWADTPKASHLRFNDDGTVTYYPNTERSWTLAFEAIPTVSERMNAGTSFADACAQVSEESERTS